MRLALPATALVLTGAAVFLALPGVLRAADETPHDAVERLLPQLMSEDDTTRADAERKLFALGEPGRAEVERVTRDTDPRRAITALRLLASPKWPTGERVTGAERTQRENRAAGAEDDPSVRIDDLRAQVERQFEAMRKRMEQFDHGFDGQVPQIDLRGLGNGARSSGSVVENDRRTSWSVAEDGRIKVTMQDGKDTPEQTVEAKDLDELKKEHPEVAKRVEPMMGSTRTFVFRSPPTLRMFRNIGPGGSQQRVDPSALDAPPAPVLGVEWSPVPEVLRDQLDLPEGGMVVETIVKDSLAEKLGLLRHDVLIEIAGKSVNGSPDVRAALDGVKPGDTVKAVVVRKGLKKALEVAK